jgi:hypothetical protein
MESIMLICLLTARPAAAALYTQTLQELGAERVEVAATIYALIDLLARQPACGIAVDVPAVVRASASAKQLISDIDEIYPLVRLNWAPGKQITAMGNRFIETKLSQLQAFVLACRKFTPRSLRRQERVARVMQLHWQLIGEMTSEPVRGFTLDVSAGGCFVCAFDPPPVGSLVRLAYCDGENSPPVTGRVAWNVPWGEESRPPGFGCIFTDVSPSGS